MPSQKLTLNKILINTQTTPHREDLVRSFVQFQEKRLARPLPTALLARFYGRETGRKPRCPQALRPGKPRGNDWETPFAGSLFMNKFPRTLSGLFEYNGGHPRIQHVAVESVVAFHEP